MAMSRFRNNTSSLFEASIQGVSRSVQRRFSFDRVAERIDAVIRSANQTITANEKLAAIRLVDDLEEAANRCRKEAKRLRKALR